jgi:hypothetical protein
LAFYSAKHGFRLLTDQPFDGVHRWLELGIPVTSAHVVLLGYACGLEFALRPTRFD